MGFFACHITKTDKTEDLLRLMDQAGIVPFDHYSETDEAFLVELTTEEIERLNHHGVQVDIDSDLGALAMQRKAERAELSHDDADDDLTTGFADHYMDAAEASQRIQALAAEFPALCQHIILPYATEGYDGSNLELIGPAQVHMLRITTTPGILSKPGLLLVCGTHAREWVNPLIAIEFAEQLLRNYSPGDPDPDIARINNIVEQGDVFIVPVMNPDGLNYSFYDNAGWRKNRRSNVGFPACPGVDNNRNYDIYFGGSGSSSSACSGTYRGTAAFSEYENQNIRHILETYPNILIGVDSHSRGEKIFRPTSSGGSYIASLPVSAEDEAIYADLETAALAAIQSVSGTAYLTGTTSNHAGTSDEYMFFAHRVFGFDFECAQSFQPPIADALVSIQEITSALLVLAEKAVDLDVVNGDPSSIVQCIDRTGSMVVLGYEANARANARRFIDLMSMGDSTAIVSFADPSSDPLTTPLDERAIIEAPYTEIESPLAYSELRDSIDAISFGGWTSIGAGLQKAVDQLAGAISPKAIVLISDGFENREPMVAAILPTIPSDIRVYTIALGDTADTMLLADIASATGGMFYQSPGGLELHEIYNQIRADVSDDDLVINEVLECNDDIAECDFWVEPNAHRLNLSCSWENDRYAPKVRLFSPAGRQVKQEDWGVATNAASSYLISTVCRPAAGQWHVVVEGPPAQIVVAAFVKSPLRASIVPVYEYGKKTFKATLLTQLRHGEMSWTEPNGSAVLRSVKQYSGQKRHTERMMHHENLDTIPFPGLLDRNTHTAASQSTQPFFAALKPWNPSPTLAGKDDPGAISQRHTTQERPGLSRKLAAVAYDDLNRDIIYTARMRVHGQLGSGFNYQRTALRTISALTPACNQSNNIWLVLGVIKNSLGKPVRDVVVEAMDKDLFCHDRLGSAISDKAGKFEIHYNAEAFTDLIFDQRPDIYLRVLS
ncbi:MAG: VWA domain-containing protein, partial [Phycisphaeraceae bacterium]|nr:VWA domain-containing protein [Phycisphaeraceae bacterium]